MSDIFKSADWARDVERARAEIAKPDGIVTGPSLEYCKALIVEAAKEGETMVTDNAYKDCWFIAERGADGLPDGNYTARRMPSGEIVARSVPRATIWPQYYDAEQSSVD